MRRSSQRKEQGPGPLGSGWISAYLRLLREGEGHAPDERLQSLLVVLHNRFVRPLLRCESLERLRVLEGELLPQFMLFRLELLGPVQEVLEAQGSSFLAGLTEMGATVEALPGLTLLDEATRAEVRSATDALAVGGLALLQSPVDPPSLAAYLGPLAYHATSLELNLLACWWALEKEPTLVGQPAFDGLVALLLEASIGYRYVIRQMGIDLDGFRQETQEQRAGRILGLGRHVLTGVDWRPAIS